MTNDEKKTKQKPHRHLRVPVSPNEETSIKTNAAKTGLTIAEYLRRLGLGLDIKSIIDQQQVIELAKINADLGRLGGLLKLWLTNDERLAHLDSTTIMTLLERIRLTQATMLAVIHKL